MTVCAVQDQLKKNVQQIQGSQSAFAAIIGDGSVVIWGAIGNGDVSSAVKDQLKNVQQIHANLFGLAANSWGCPVVGRGAGAVQDQLKRNVQQIHANFLAFAAILGGMDPW